MLRFSANLTLMFNEIDFMSRFEAAARSGFEGVEYMFPYDWRKEDLSRELEGCGLQQVLFNLPAGDFASGERGIACIPGREREFRSGVALAAEYAKTLKCPRLNCLVGRTPIGVPAEEVGETLVNNLRFAAQTLETEGIRLLIEALNDRDFPGFHLIHTADALRLLKQVDHANLFIQYDIYHMQIMEGNLTNTLLDSLGRIAHIQLADNPGRHEPGTGEINYGNLLRFIDEAGYSGWIGCEYKPLGLTEEGLVWLKPYLRKGGD